MFTTAQDILAYVGVKTPSDVETQWAEACARAVNAGIATRLNADVILNPPPDELIMAATMAGGEAYKRREAPFGITGWSDNEGVAVRLAKDYLDGVKPLIDRYGFGPGIG